MTTAKMELLKVNPHALQGLHNLLGYDFEKPHTIAKLDGRFTVKQAARAVNPSGKSGALTLLVRDSAIPYRKKLLIVRVLESGNIEIDFKKYYKWDLDKAYSKKEFEEYRKSDTAQCFAVFQESMYGGRIPVPAEPDYSERFTIISDKYNLFVKPRDGRGEAVTFAVHGKAEMEKMIDKSGYLLHMRRDELKRRAAGLRRERAQQAYRETDNAAKVKELSGILAAIQKGLAAMLEKAKTASDFSAVASLMSKLNWRVYDFESFAQHTEKRDCPSIEVANRYYESTKAKLIEILQEVA